MSEAAASAIACGAGRPTRTEDPILDVVEDVVRREREAQLKHWDALDAKTGVMLGFAGVLAALAPVDVNVLVDVGRMSAVAGALAALWAFWPRGYGAIDVRTFRERYLASEPTFARMHLTDTQIAVGRELAVTLDRKTTRIKRSMALIAAAGLLVAPGLLVD